MDTTHVTRYSQSAFFPSLSWFPDSERSHQTCVSLEENPLGFPEYSEAQVSRPCVPCCCARALMFNLWRRIIHSFMRSYGRHFREEYRNKILEEDIPFLLLLHAPCVCAAYDVETAPSIGAGYSDIRDTRSCAIYYDNCHEECHYPLWDP